MYRYLLILKGDIMAEIKINSDDLLQVKTMMDNINDLLKNRHVRLATQREFDQAYIIVYNTLNPESKITELP